MFHLNLNSWSVMKLNQQSCLAGEDSNPQTPQQKLAPKAPVLKTRMNPLGSANVKHNQNLTAAIKAQPAKTAAQLAQKLRPAKKGRPPKLLMVLEVPEDEGGSQTEKIELSGAVKKAQVARGSAEVAQMCVETAVAGKAARQSVLSIQIDTEAASAFDVAQAAPKHHKTRREDDKVNEKKGKSPWNLFLDKSESKSYADLLSCLPTLHLSASLLVHSQCSDPCLTLPLNPVNANRSTTRNKQPPICKMCTIG